MGIDLNPNYIALSIIDIDKSGETVDVYKEIIDLKALNKCKKTTKKRYELTQVALHIVNLCRSHHVETVCLEDLNIKSGDKGLGTAYNRLVNNTWIRNYFVLNLKKWLNIKGIRYRSVVPHYTSFIGQMKFENDYDSVAAAKEIAYRGYLINIFGSQVSKELSIYDTNKYILSKQWDYIHGYLGKGLSTRWKDMITLASVITYKELYHYYKDNKKKSTTSYRFLFNDDEKLKWSSFRLNSNKSLVDLIRF